MHKEKFILEKRSTPYSKNLTHGDYYNPQVIEDVIRREQLIQNDFYDDNKSIIYNLVYNCDIENLIKEINRHTKHSVIDRTINWKNKRDQGWTPLMRASYNGNIDCVNVLLNSEYIKIDEVDSQGRSAIFLASYANKLNVVLALLNKHANINIKPFSGNWKDKTPAQVTTNDDIKKNLSNKDKQEGGKKSRKRKTKKTKSKKSKKTRRSRR